MALKKSLVLLFLGTLVACVGNNAKASNPLSNSLASLKSYDSTNEIKTAQFNNNNLQEANNNILVPNFLKEKTNGLHYNPKLNNMKQTFAMHNLKQNIVPSTSPFAFNKFAFNKFENKENNTNLANLNNNLLQNNENEKDIFQNVSYNIAPSFGAQTQFKPKMNENNFVQPLNNNKFNVQQSNNAFNNNPGVMIPTVNNINNPTNPKPSLILPKIVNAHKKPSMLNNNVEPTKFGPFVNLGKSVNNINALNNNNSPVTFGNQQNNQLLSNDLRKNDEQDGSFYQLTVLGNGDVKKTPLFDNIILPKFKLKTNLLSQNKNNNLYANKGIFYNQQVNNNESYSLQQRDLLEVTLDGFDGVRSILHHAIFKELAKYNVKKFKEYMINLKNGIDVNTIVNDLNDLITSMPSLKNKKHVLLSLLNNLLRNHFEVQNDDILLNFMNDTQYENIDFNNIEDNASSVIRKLIECLGNEQMIAQFNCNDFKYLLEILDKQDYNNNTVVALLLYDLINNSSRIDEFYKILRDNIAGFKPDTISEVKKHLMLSMLIKRASELSSSITLSVGTNNSIVNSEWIDFIMEMVYVYSTTFSNYQYDAKDLLVNKVADTLNIIGSQLDNKQTIMTNARSPMNNVLLNWHLLCKTVKQVNTGQGNNPIPTNYANNLFASLSNNVIYNIRDNTIGAWSEINGKNAFVAGLPNGYKVLNIVNMLRVIADQINTDEDNNRAVDLLNQIKQQIDPDNKHDIVNDFIVLASSRDVNNIELYRLVLKYLREHGFGLKDSDNTTLYHNNIARIPSDTRDFSGIQNVIKNIAKQRNLHVNIKDWNKFFLSNEEYCQNLAQTRGPLSLQLKNRRAIGNIINNVITGRNYQTVEPLYYVFGDSECRDIFSHVMQYFGNENYVPNTVSPIIDHFIAHAPSQIMRSALVECIDKILNAQRNPVNILALLETFDKYMKVINSSKNTYYSLSINALEELAEEYDNIIPNVMHLLSQAVDNRFNQELNNKVTGLYNELVYNVHGQLQQQYISHQFSNILKYDLNFVQEFIQLTRTLSNTLTPVLNHANLNNADDIIYDFEDRFLNLILANNVLLSQLQFIQSSGKIPVTNNTNNSLSFVNKEIYSEQIIQSIISNDALLNKYQSWAFVNGLHNYGGYIQNHINMRAEQYNRAITDVNNDHGWTRYDRVADYTAYAKIVYNLASDLFKKEFNNNSNNSFLKDLAREKNTIINVLAKSLKAYKNAQNNSLFDNLNNSLYYVYCLFQVILSRTDNATKNALLSHDELDLVSAKKLFTETVLSRDLNDLFLVNNLELRSNSLFVALVWNNYMHRLLGRADDRENDNLSLYSNMDMSNDSIISSIVSHFNLHN